MTHHLFDIDDTSIPHLDCILVQDTVPDDGQLMRSELMCATAIMVGRLYAKEYMAHKIVPVRSITMLATFAG